MDHLVSGKDAVVLMPTGGGKSVCFQVPALVRPGICLVVSPLISLMEDQLQGLKARGIKALGLYGRLSEDELVQRLDNASFGGYKFLYLSPERLSQELVLKRLETLPVNLIAIDEAHCISQWGFDFRPAYLECARLREILPDVPVAALTATAPAAVLQDIQQILNLEEAAVFRQSVVRGNLRLRVCATEDKRYRLQAALQAHPGPGIVYVQTRRSSVKLAAFLNQQGIPSCHFHGGMPEEAKRKTLEAWQREKVRVVVATNAFGMGIDKANVRLVAHYEIPETLEHYYQEAGRGGRDGDPATALLLVSPSDADKTRSFFLDNLPGIPDLIQVYRALCNNFQVPYGELPEETYSLEFEAFCSQYGLPRNKTFQALEVLDRQGLIRLRPLVKTEIKIQMLGSKAALWDYLERMPHWQPLLQALLRTYGGIFDYPTEIRLGLLAKKLNWPESRILEGLSQLEQDGLTEVERHQGDLQLQFLQPREDAHSIHAFAGSYQKRQGVKREKINQMLAFVANTTTCRRIQLMAYFGEPETAPCGHCDVCMPEAAPRTPTQILRGHILNELKEGPKTSRDLCAARRVSETQVLEQLQQLLEDGTISLNPANRYYLNTT